MPFIKTKQLAYLVGILLFFNFSSIYASSNKEFSANRFSFEIKLNEYTPSSSNFRMLCSYKILDEDNTKSLGVGCIDSAGLEKYIDSKSAENQTEAESVSTKIIPFAFELSNRASFASLGSSKNFHKYVYWDVEFSLNNYIEIMGRFMPPKYATAISALSNIGMVFPIVSHSPAKHSFIAFTSPANVDFNFILEFGLGFEHYSYHGDYKFSNLPEYFSLTPTFSFMSSLSFAKLPNLEIETGLRVLPAWRLDFPIRLQYDFYENSRGVKMGIVANYDLWFLSGGLGFAVRY